MAPKLADIKSESWLDLTKEQPINRPKWLLRRAQTQVPESSESSCSSDTCWSGDLSRVRGSTRAAQQIEEMQEEEEEEEEVVDFRRDLIKRLSEKKVIKSEEQEEETRDKRQLGRRRRLSPPPEGSTCSLQASTSQDHLLIRIRQESFKFSRRRSSLSDMNQQRQGYQKQDSFQQQQHHQQSTTTTTSTSQSILAISCTSSLEHSLKISDIIDDLQHESSRGVKNHSIDHQHQHQLTSIPSRLQRFKSRLEGRSRRSSSLLRADCEVESEVNSAQTDHDKAGSLFNQRSFSSLSDKFSHLRRSWRKFLSSSSQSINQKPPSSNGKLACTKNRHTSNILFESKAQKQRSRMSDIRDNHHPPALISSDNNWRPLDDATDPINKQILTERWLANHHQLDRPRSLQLDRLESYGRQNNVAPPTYRYDNNLIRSVSIGRDSSSSTTLVEPQLISNNRDISSFINYQNQTNEPKARAISLQPTRLLEQKRKNHNSQNKQIFALNSKDNSRFASLKTDTEKSSTTNSSRTTTTSSSQYSYSFAGGRLGTRSKIMQQGDHQNLSPNDQTGNKPRQFGLANIPSFAPQEDYYLEAADEDEDTNGEAYKTFGFIDNDHHQHQHQLMIQQQPPGLGLWPVAANGASQLRGHSVEAQLSTGGSSSLERQPLDSTTMYNNNDNFNTQMMMMQRSQISNQQQHHLQQQIQQNNLLNDVNINPINMNLNTDMNTMIMMMQNQTEDPDYDDYAIPSDENFCRLDRTQVELVQMIGEGQKGFVFLGKLQSRDGQQIIDVAIKTLKYETEAMIEKLMHEAAMMRQFEHPHIIRFIGVCPETPALIAMELAKLGELRNYLRTNQHLISVSQLVLFSFQISTALSYLESKQFVHRDVAARNVLVCSHTCVKLADFGLSRNLQLEPPGCQYVATPSNRRRVLETGASRQNPAENQQQINHSPSSQLLLEPEDKSGHYVAVSPGKLPVRWLAPESLAFRRFTSASDVWMFAVCAWEIFYLGQLRPWPHIANNQVLSAIGAGRRLTRPPACPIRLYQLLLQCWSFAPVQRPKFRDIKQELWSIYLNERTREQMLIDEAIEREKHECDLLALAAAARQQKHEQQQQQMHEKRMRQILKQQEINRQHQLTQKSQAQSPIMHEDKPSNGNAHLSDPKQRSLANSPSSPDSRPTLSSNANRKSQSRLSSSINQQQLWKPSTGQLSELNVSPEPGSISTGSSRVSNNNNNNVNSSSLARHRRLLLKSSQGTKSSASVPEPVFVDSSGGSTSSHRLQNALDVELMNAYQQSYSSSSLSRKRGLINTRDELDNSANNRASGRRRNQLQKQRSHGNIIGFGLDKSASPPPFNSANLRSRYKDDQALMDEERRHARESYLQAGNSERLLNFPQQTPSMKTHQSFRATRTARTNHENSGPSHHDPSHSDISRTDAKNHKSNSGYDPDGRRQPGRPEQIDSRPHQQPVYEGVRNDFEQSMVDGSLTDSFQNMQIAKRSNQNNNHDHGGDEHIDQYLDDNSAQKRELDQRNRLDLHRRLLGHIRPASSAGGSRARDRANRNSLNLTSGSSESRGTRTDTRGKLSNVSESQNQQHHNPDRPLPNPPSGPTHRHVETVDQSLEILASLISTTNTSGKMDEKTGSRGSNRDHDDHAAKERRLVRKRDKTNISSVASSPFAGAPRPKSRESEIQQQWRKIGREFEMVKKRGT